MSGADRRSFLLAVQACVTLSEGQVTIVLSRDRLRRVLDCNVSTVDHRAIEPTDSEPNHQSDMLAIDIPMRLRFCSGEMRIVIPPAHATEMRPRPNAVLIKAVMRAHRWRQRVFSGEASSIKAIAEEEGPNERYVGRILRLAFLAPDIVEAILEGRQPADLDLDRLLDGVPIDWADQRRVFGFQTSQAA